jgi:dipeptidase
MAAPSIHLSPLTDAEGSFGYGPDGSEPYPFSVKPDAPLDVQFVMNVMRDNYLGTPFDLTEDPAAGPFGDVIRSKK